tara:strand:- start:28 stop:408 length:381 start_codon:yes stop_codon:yes gene_type:complete
MKTYTKHITFEVDAAGDATAKVEDVSYFDEDRPRATIPEEPGNRHYDAMLAEVVADEAEIVEVDITVYPDIPTMRQRMYAKEGIPTEELVVALWERIVEGRTADEAGITGLQTRRVVVKNTHPKPE